MLVLAAADPAQPYGAAISWPKVEGRPNRSAGAYVILDGGQLACFVERGGKSIVVFDRESSWVDGLKRLVEQNNIRLEVAQINSKPAAENPELRQGLLDAGFVAGYKGLSWKAS